MLLELVTLLAGGLRESLVERLQSFEFTLALLDISLLQLEILLKQAYSGADFLALFLDIIVVLLRSLSLHFYLRLELLVFVEFSGQVLIVPLQL